MQCVYKYRNFYLYKVLNSCQKQLDDLEKNIFVKLQLHIYVISSKQNKSIFLYVSSDLHFSKRQHKQVEPIKKDN